jgi:hypothetical protein
MISAKKQISTSILSFLLSFLAFSHHWLHMGILILLGVSTDLTVVMGTMFWVRRIMIIGTFITMLFSLYRLYKHRCKDKKIIFITAILVIPSLYFIINSLIKFGW